MVIYKKEIRRTMHRNGEYEDLVLKKTGIMGEQSLLYLFLVVCVLFVFCFF